MKAMAISEPVDCGPSTRSTRKSRTTLNRLIGEPSALVTWSPHGATLPNSPNERASLDAVSAGCFAVLHRSSLPEALRAVRERPVDAVVLSVNQCPREHVELVDHLVRGFPTIPMVALVSRHDDSVPESGESEPRR